MLQLLQYLAAQGMGDPMGLHAPFPPNLPPQLAGLMQVCHPLLPSTVLPLAPLHSCHHSVQIALLNCSALIHQTVPAHQIFQGLHMGRYQVC